MPALRPPSGTILQLTIFRALGTFNDTISWRSTGHSLWGSISHKIG